MWNTSLVENVIMSPSLKVTDQHLPTSVLKLPNLVWETSLKNLSARQIQCMSSSTPTIMVNVLAGGLFGVRA